MNPEQAVSLPQASVDAGRVDLLIFALTALAVVISIGISAAVVYFGIRYRRSNQDVDRSMPPESHLGLEIVWTGIPLIVGLGLFWWASTLYYQEFSAPPDAMPIYVIGKQWMWKVYYPDGQKEINALHVPMGRPVKLILTSQDVVHSLGIPAFRIKHDAVPGRYTSFWFVATQPGQYHMFCNQYCGTKHSEMKGTVTVMEPAAYDAWLTSQAPAVSLAGAGRQTFQKMGCAACHREDGTGRGPSLVGLSGKQVKLTGGQTVTADDEYVRESIVNPRAKVVAGYQPLMPAYDTMLDEQAILELLAYIQSLRPAGKEQ